MHVYEDRFPLVPQATFKPPHAPLADYRAVQRTLSLLVRCRKLHPGIAPFEQTKEAKESRVVGGDRLSRAAALRGREHPREGAGGGKTRSVRLGQQLAASQSQPAA